MCNLCSSSLFLVPNPCCCCELKCGVMWVGVFEIIIGLLSLYFPSTLGNLEWKAINSQKPAGAQHEDQEEPVFDVFIPWAQSSFFRGLQKTGCFTIQIVLGVIIFWAANGMGGHNFAKFITGCIWLVIRVITMMIMLLFTSNLRKTNHPPLMRYSVYIICKFLLIDIYFFIVVRYWTMDCYDTFRYNRASQIYQLPRRLEPYYSKSAPKTEKGSFFWSRKKDEGKTQQVPQEIMDLHHKKRARDITEIEAAPVWDRKNEVIFYGEDYTDWDPHLFQTRWELLNETYNTEHKGRKSMAQEALEALKGRGGEGEEARRPQNKIKSAEKSGAGDQGVIRGNVQPGLGGGRGRGLPPPPAVGRGTGGGRGRM